MTYATPFDMSDIAVLRAELVLRDRRIAQLQNQVDDLTFAVTKSDSIRVGVTRTLECARDGLLVASRLTEDERVHQSFAIVEQFFSGKANAESQGFSSSP